MRDSNGRDGAENQSESDEDAIRILYVGAEKRAIALRDAVSGDESFSVTTADRPGERQVSEYDCTVLETGDADWQRVASCDTPVVLYTETDPGALTDATLAETDRIVDRSGEKQTAALAANVRGAVTGNSSPPATERERYERRLERYEAIVRALADPICALDEAGRFTEVNDAFESTTGYNAADLRGEPPTMVMSGPDAERIRTVAARLDDPGRDGKETVEVELFAHDGTPIPTECHVALLPTGGGYGSVVVMRDITERKRRETRLENFATVVSHDLRNPMDVALGRAEVLPEIADVDESTEKHLDDIYDSLKRMERLVEDVLTLTCGNDEQVTTEPVDLGEVAWEAWDNVRTGSATLEVDADVTVQAGRGRLLRLFENLFRNAVEHSSTSPRSHAHGDAVEHGSTSPQSQAPEDAVEHSSTSPRSHTREDAVEHSSTSSDPDSRESTVTVEVGTAEVDREHAEVTFYVADDGPGIPDDIRDRVFEDGFTTGENGTGLGLAIVREVARCHGWSVDLTDAESGGAQFEFTGIPLGTD